MNAKKKENRSIFFFLFLLNKGNIKKAKKRPNPKCIALAGTSIKTPKPKMKGKGDAYHN